MSAPQRWIKEPFPALSHVVGVLLSVLALVVLLLHTHGHIRLIIGFAVYGASLITLYSASALTHGLRVSPKNSDRLDRFDYAAIFLLIAGTYTPLCLVTLRGPWGWSLLSVEWTLASVGIAAVVFGRASSNWFRVAVYCAMGWLALFAVGPLVWRCLQSALPGWWQGRLLLHRRRHLRTRPPAYLAGIFPRPRSLASAGSRGERLPLSPGLQLRCPDVKPREAVTNNPAQTPHFRTLHRPLPTESNVPSAQIARLLILAPAKRHLCRANGKAILSN